MREGGTEVVDKARMNRRIGKTLFLIVMFILRDVVMIADRIQPGSHKIAGALLGFVGLAAFFGGPLSALDRLRAAALS